MNGELPQGWESAALAQLTENPKQDIISGPFGSNLKSNEYVSEGVPIIRLQNVDRNRFLEKNMRFITLLKARELSAHNFRAGDVVVTKLGDPLGKACAIPVSLPHGIVVADVVRVRIDERRFSRSYVLFAINSPAVVNQINSEMMGSTRPRVNLNNIRDLQIPVAPLAEQLRIVTKLEKLLGHVDTCQQRLAKIPTLLRRFRQATLDAATTGKLTVDWRNNAGRKYDARNELNSYLAAAERHRPRTREAEPTEGHETLTDTIPQGWATPPLDDLFRFIDYRGKTPKKSRSGKRLISAKNIKMGYISEEPVEYVSEKYYDAWMTRGFPKKDDIFFVTEGHTMGFAALNNRADKFALSQRTITLQPWEPLLTHCFFYFIMSPIFQNLVRLNATGSAAVGIKAAKFRGLPIPFPPLHEQEEIVRRVEKLFALADRIEAHFFEGRKRVDSITQAILAKAFHGELVPTEFELAKAQGRPFESAEDLLGRIKRNGDAESQKRLSFGGTRPRERRG